MSLGPVFSHKCSWLGGTGLLGEGNALPQDMWLGKGTNAGAAGAGAFQLHPPAFQLLGPLPY